MTAKERKETVAKLTKSIHSLGISHSKVVAKDLLLEAMRFVVATVCGFVIHAQAQRNLTKTKPLFRRSHSLEAL